MTKPTNEIIIIIGFVDLGDGIINYATLDNGLDELATHVLVFYVIGLSTELKFSKRTSQLRVSYLIKLCLSIWKVVCLLELSCSIQVVAAVSDRASFNRKFYRMHKGLQTNAVDDSVVTRQSTSLGRIMKFFSFLMSFISSKPVEIACSTQVVVVVPGICGTIVVFGNVVVDVSLFSSSFVFV